MNKSPFADILDSLKERIKDDPEALELLTRLEGMLDSLVSEVERIIDIDKRVKEIRDAERAAKEARGQEKHSTVPTLEDRVKAREKAREKLEAMREAKGQVKH